MHSKHKHKLSITLVKSRTGRLPRHAATLKGLGLRKLQQTVILEDTPCIQGMLNQVSYLVKVEKVNAA